MRTYLAEFVLIGAFKSNKGEDNNISCFLLILIFTNFFNNRVMKKIKIFAVALIATMALSTAGTVTAANTTVQATAEASAENWDVILNQYEQYVNKYIATLKKVQKGDPKAAADLASLAEKAQRLASKLENAEDNMTAAQLARFNRIVQKMTKAAASF